jgi:putative ATP-binding cassette transporter
MNEVPPEAPARLAEPEEGEHAGLRAQLGWMLQALRESPAGRAVLALSVSISLIIAATAYWQIRLNSWNKPFFDALSRRDLPAFWVQLGMFFVIAGTLLVLNVAQRWLVETLKVRMREALMHDLLGAWMEPRRAFWLANAGPIGVNPDQRMHEDARKLCELSADLGAGLLQATILFVSFAGVLWLLSAEFSVRISERDYAIPGFMLWAAVLYAGAGSLLSYRVGRGLIRRNAQRYAAEAELRFSLVRVNEHLDGIALAGGEADERRRAELDLAGVLAATRRLVTGLTNLTWVTAGFGWVTNVAPILVAAPLYFAGKISFGGMMMAAAAFTQAQSSLRWFVDNFSVIADWRATLLRVADFRFALGAAGSPPGFAGRIDYAPGEPGVLSIEGLQIASRAGNDVLQETPVSVRAGERVRISAAPGTAKSQLFRALAGLWPWGAGTIRVPREDDVLFVPRGAPYLPRGTLREILAYPRGVERFEAPAFERALARLGLDRLRGLLDQERRWERELTEDEQLALSFARIVLHEPSWVLIDDTLGSLDEELLARFLDVLERELRGTAVIHVGRIAAAQAAVFSRELHLVRGAGQPQMPEPPP